ncbi:pyridoxamine 5'-phosphate oxidase family protein [Bacillus sp. 1P06AnD]|uniref:pyridoxamine 5'-phosphate oxidase family protein n=1 Tax=Bacillus sp. 1P06AnD TaxID=3132208 RepID=UPI0039A3BAA4
MTKDQAVQKLSAILEDSRVGVLSSVKQNKPKARYMTFFNDGSTLYTPTSADTCKVDELEKNPSVHVIVGYEGEGFGDAYVEIEGHATISENQSLKEKMWDDSFKAMFTGDNDPDYVILEIKPAQMTINNRKQQLEPEIISFQ